MPFFARQAYSYHLLKNNISVFFRMITVIMEKDYFTHLILHSFILRNIYIIFFCKIINLNLILLIRVVILIVLKTII